MITCECNGAVVCPAEAPFPVVTPRVAVSLPPDGPRGEAFTRTTTEVCCKPNYWSEVCFEPVSAGVISCPEPTSALAPALVLLVLLARSRR